ncbi:MAG TPA: hypothetical protein VIJ96_16150 [Acidothermaceae bacterium]
MTLRFLYGSSKELHVITNREDTKSGVPATAATTRFLRGGDAPDVAVRDDGAPALDPAGMPILRGYGIDRKRVVRVRPRSQLDLPGLPPRNQIERVGSS